MCRFIAVLVLVSAVMVAAAPLLAADAARAVHDWV
jgi:hypothetical protein